MLFLSDSLGFDHFEKANLHLPLIHEGFHFTVLSASITLECTSKIMPLSLYGSIIAFGGPGKR